MKPNYRSIGTGAQLRSLYEPQGGVGQIFASKVSDYVASRPDYPVALFDTLRTECRLQPGATVADIGAGTGLLTQGLLAEGYAVTAVEPNAGMRAAADQLLGQHRGYSSVDGTAEHIPLPAASVDLVTAAQAFHWFEIEAARTEFLRVLKPGGHVALIWNDRVLSDPLHIALNEILAQYGGAKRSALLAHEERGDVPLLFGAGTSTTWTWPHKHLLDETALISLVFSRSYMPEPTSNLGRQASQQVRAVFQRLAIDGQVAVRYTTVAVLGIPQ